MLHSQDYGLNQRKLFVIYFPYNSVPDPQIILTDPVIGNPNNRSESRRLINYESGWILHAVAIEKKNVFKYCKYQISYNVLFNIENFSEISSCFLLNSKDPAPDPDGRIRNPAVQTAMTQ
jgi:hypothetical protein